MNGRATFLLRATKKSVGTLQLKHEAHGKNDLKMHMVVLKKLSQGFIMVG
jgi:hypothetical protein